MPRASETTAVIEQFICKDFFFSYIPETRSSSLGSFSLRTWLLYCLDLHSGEVVVEHLSVFDCDSQKRINAQPSAPPDQVLTSYLVNVIRDLKQHERWRHGHQNGNRKLILSLFQWLTRQIRTAGVKTKAFRFTVWDRSFPFKSETSNFWLLFMTSGTSAFSLLQLAIIDCQQSFFS